MKKLIVPIIIGLVMFGAAFGGAFYFFRSDKARQEAAIKAVTATVLETLQKQGKAVVYTGRVVAVATPEAAAPAPAPETAAKNAGEAEAPAPAAHKGQAAHAPAVAHSEEVATHEAAPAPAAVSAGAYAIVPATVRYELDFKALRNKDVVWDEEAQALKVTLPALSIAEPAIDGANIRHIGGAAPEDAVRRGALGALLEQAREDAALGQARETARQMVERAFALPLLVEGVKKAKVVVRFADEPVDEDEEEEGGAGGH
ncbi:DUF4230 domain-containing protein [Sphingobium sp. DEHP117]|uniref:DUF4230 domain-containing protein n=1 Tax=Sphingobium sp. DEHP117 TaxID=2993436 RepID=UPI0027D49BF6|nr:DUF4230 domain-containing protein [Sphingobium sp. DEHP117]MDQ4421287.1 DUF4230 domain-containing protein [Sphingobium sp. DEHP117]